MAVTQDLSRGLLIAALVALTGRFCLCQNAPSRKSEIKLTGIVLTADHRCSRSHAEDVLCRSSDWALVSGRKTYLLNGDIPSLERFERKRVKVSGLLEEAPEV